MKRNLTPYAGEEERSVLPYQADATAFKEACNGFYDEVWSAGKE